MAGRPPDPRGPTGHQGDPARQGLGLGQQLQLAFLQLPVLDPELLGLVDRLVGGDSLGAAHDVDGVDVELAGHPGSLLVLAEGEHPDTRHEHDRRVGAAHRRGVGAGVALVVGSVLLPVGVVELLQPGLDPLQRRVGGSVQQQRPDLGAQEVVRAGGPEGDQAVKGLPGQEVKDHLAVGVVADHAGVGRGDPAQQRDQLGRPVPPLGLTERRPVGADRPERLRAAGALDELGRLADEPERPLLAFVAGCAPAGQPVPAEHHTLEIGVVLQQLAVQPAQLPARAGPRGSRPPGRRSTRRSGARRRRWPPGRSRCRGGGGRCGAGRPARASGCRSTAPPRRGRRRTRRTGRPSRPRAPGPGSGRPGRAAGPAPAQPAPRTAAFPGRRRSP